MVEFWTIPEKIVNSKLNVDESYLKIQSNLYKHLRLGIEFFFQKSIYKQHRSKEFPRNRRNIPVASINQIQW